MTILAIDCNIKSEPTFTKNDQWRNGHMMMKGLINQPHFCLHTATTTTPAILQGYYVFNKNKLHYNKTVGYKGEMSSKQWHYLGYHIYLHIQTEVTCCP